MDLFDLAGLDIPNLTDADDDTLSRLHRLYMVLQEYCGHTLTARDYRRKGMVDDAIHYEKKAQKCYDQVPSNLKW